MKSGVSNVNISDHLLVHFLKKKKKDIPFKVDFQGRSYVDYKKDTLTQTLSTYDWADFFYVDDPNIPWHLFLNI